MCLGRGYKKKRPLIQAGGVELGSEFGLGISDCLHEVHAGPYPITVNPKGISIRLCA